MVIGWLCLQGGANLDTECTSVNRNTWAMSKHAKVNFFTINQLFKLLKPNFQENFNWILFSQDHATHLWCCFCRIPSFNIHTQSCQNALKFQNCNSIRPLYNSWKFQPNQIVSEISQLWISEARSLKIPKWKL